MGVQDLTLSMVLIVAVGVFLASFMDAIAGGGGIISVPTYLLAGLPMHVALGTNKLSAGLGSLASTGRYIKRLCRLEARRAVDRAGARRLALRH